MSNIQQNGGISGQSLASHLAELHQSTIPDERRLKLDDNQLSIPKHNKKTLLWIRAIFFVLATVAVFISKYFILVHQARLLSSHSLLMIQAATGIGSCRSFSHLTIRFTKTSP
eukprot:TRINITY_DN1213_c0_g1_i3.p1 TRINITY_DN1213_c0_g1~~TRINITY_DN1213_c0_g1_i3.p1  ORF type:complete len:113 (-),score=7.73 TRINITY_DN1213_c0_g1_i3:413-751(-)